MTSRSTMISRLAFAVFLLCGTSSAFADNPGAAKSVPDAAQTGNEAAGSTAIVKLAPSDRDFVVKATQANVAEHLRGEAAAQYGGSPLVKKLAGTLASEHAMLNQKLAEAVATADIQPGHDPSDADAAEITKLKSLDKTAFDKAYLADEMKAHREAIALYKKEASADKNANLATYARQALPGLKKHEQEIRNVQGELSK